MTFETRTYRLTVLSPLHIGCDHVYEPTSFVVRNDEKKLISFDPLHFLESLEREDVEKFSALCKQGTIESLLDIYRFINNKGQETDGVKVEVSQDFLKHYKHVLEMPRHKIKSELNSFLINRTAFNPITENVYIPGSAIKGSLRTAILNTRHSKSPLPGSYMHRGGSRDFQKDILDGGQFQTDPFSRVKVSDFKPAGETQRKIVYAVDCKKKPEKGEPSALYQIFEVIVPGTVFEGSISIQEPHGKDGIRHHVSFKEVERSLSAFFAEEKKREAKEAAVIGADHVADAGVGKLEMRLGRHSGAECVTVEGKRKIRIMTGKKGESATLDRATTIWFASDMRKPVSKEGLQPFGWVALHPASDDEMVESMEFEEQEQERLVQKWSMARQKREEAKREKKRTLEQQALERREREKAEEEAKKYPWRALMRELDGIDDWGRFRQLVLDNESTVSWREVAEFANAVYEAASRVCTARPDKWTTERDELTASWLEPSGVAWKSIAEQVDGSDKEEPPLVKKIKEYTDWGNYKQDPVVSDELDADAAHALAARFREWGCNGKKVKKDKKKAWQDLQSRLKKLK